MAMGGEYLNMRTLLFIPLFLLLSCSDERKSPVVVNRQYNNIRIDSFIVKKIFARAKYIDSLSKNKKYEITDSSYKQFEIEALNCIGYRFSWSFKPNNLHVVNVDLYSASILRSSFVEEQYYYNNKSFYITDADGNTGLMDFGLRLYYSFYLHSFTDGPISTYRYDDSAIYKTINNKGVRVLDNIKEWDSLYDAQHFR